MGTHHLMELSKIITKYSKPVSHMQKQISIHRYTIQIQWGTI